MQVSSSGGVKQKQQDGRYPEWKMGTWRLLLNREMAMHADFTSKHPCIDMARERGRQAERWKWPPKPTLSPFARAQGTTIDELILGDKGAAKGRQQRPRRTWLIKPTVTSMGNITIENKKSESKKNKKSEKVSGEATRVLDENGQPIQRWCQQAPNSTVWQEASYFQGACRPPHHPKVRSFNRFVAAATTPHPIPKTASKQRMLDNAMLSLRQGRAIWQERQRVAHGHVARPEAWPWQGGDGIIPYETKRCVYVVISRRQAETRAYVGVSAGCAYERHLKRVRDLFPEDKELKKAVEAAAGEEAQEDEAESESESESGSELEADAESGPEDEQPPPQAPANKSKKKKKTRLHQRSPFERHLLTIGKARALDEYYVMVLEHVPMATVTDSHEWEVKVEPIEKFWVVHLSTAFNRGGWNVQHAPRTLVAKNGVPQQHVPKEKIRRRRGRNGPLARFRTRLRPGAEVWPDLNDETESESDERPPPGDKPESDDDNEQEVHAPPARVGAPAEVDGQDGV